MRVVSYYVMTLSRELDGLEFLWICCIEWYVPFVLKEVLSPFLKTACKFLLYFLYLGVRMRAHISFLL